VSPGATLVEAYIRTGSASTPRTSSSPRAQADVQTSIKRPDLDAEVNASGR